MDNKNLLPTINVPSLSVPRLTVPRLRVPKLDVPRFRVSYTKPYNYQKQVRHIKDLGDLVLGDPFKGTRQLQETLKDNGLGRFVDVPLLNRALGAGLFFKESTLDPILQGNYAEAFINNLAALGDSLDILANPIKSIMPWAGGGSSTDLLKSMGWLDGAYRERYQWDTGLWLLDLAGEVASDPINWFTWGANAAVSKSIDAATDTTKQLIKYGTKGTVKDVNKYIIKQITDVVALSPTKDMSDLIPSLVERIQDNRDTLVKELKKYNKHSKNYKFIKQNIAEYDRLLANDLTGNLTKLLVHNRLDDGYRYYDAIRRYGSALSFKKSVNTIDNVITAASFGASPMFGIGRVAFKKLIKPTFQTQYNAFIRSLPDYMLSKDGMSPHTFKYIDKDIVLRNSTVRAKTYRKFKDVLAAYNIDETKLHNKFIQIYKEQHKNIAKTRKAFKKYLFKAVPELNDLYYSKATRESIAEVYNKIASVRGVLSKHNAQVLDSAKAELGPQALKKSYNHSKQIDRYIESFIKDIHDSTEELIDAVEEDAVISITAETIAGAIYKAQLDKELETFFVRYDNKIDAIQQLEYILNNILVIDGEHVPLSKLEDFLYAINNNKLNKLFEIAEGAIEFVDENGNVIKDNLPKLADTNYSYEYITAVLDYFGININNAAQLETLLKKTISYDYWKQYDEFMDSFIKEYNSIKVNQTNVTHDKITELKQTVAYYQNKLEQVTRKKVQYNALLKEAKKETDLFKAQYEKFKTAYASYIAKHTEAEPSRYVKNKMQELKRSLNYFKNKMDRATARYKELNSTMYGLNKSYKATKQTIEQLNVTTPEQIKALNADNRHIIDLADKEFNKEHKNYGGYSKAEAADMTKEIERIMHEGKTGIISEYVDYAKLHSAFAEKGIDVNPFSSKEYKKVLGRLTKTRESAVKELNDLRANQYKSATELQRIQDQMYEIFNNALGLSKENRDFAKIQEFIRNTDVFFNSDSAVDAMDEFITVSSPVKNSAHFGTFLNTDFTKGSFDIQTISELLESLQAMSLRWAKAINDPRFRSQLGDLPNNAVQAVKDIASLLNNPKMVKFTEELVDVLSSNLDYYYPKLLTPNNFDAVWRRIKVNMESTWTEKQREWFNALANKASVERKTIEELRQYLETANDGIYAGFANDIGYTLAAIDQAQAYHNLQHTVLYTYNLTKHQKAYITNLIYDTIYKYQGADYDTIINVIANPEILVNRYFKQINRAQMPLVIKDYLLQNYADELQVIVDEALNKTNVNLKSIEAIDLIDFAQNSKTLGDVFDSEGVLLRDDVVTQFEDRLYQDVKSTFTDYTNVLKDIVRNTYDDVTLTPMLATSVAIDRIRDLGYAYEDIVELLSAERPDLLEPTANYMQLTAGRTARNKQDFEERVYIDVDELEKQTSELIKKSETLTTEEGLADFIRFGFRDIALMNEEFRGSKEYLGRVMHFGRHDTHKIRAVENYIYRDNLDMLVKESTYATNIYDYMLANGEGIGFKKALKVNELYDTIDTAYGYKIKLTVDNAQEVIAFAENLKSAKAYANRIPVYSPDKVDAMRSALAKFYANTDLAFAPEDPIRYFGRDKVYGEAGSVLTDREIIAWHMATGSRLNSKSMALEYWNTYKEANHFKVPEKKKLPLEAPKTKMQFTPGEKLDYFEDPSSDWNDLDYHRKKIGFSDPEAYQDLIENLPLSQSSNLRQVITKELKRYFKDPETLLANRYNITNHIQQNVDAFEKTRVLDTQLQNNKTVKEVLGSSYAEHAETLKRYGIKGDTKFNDKQVSRFMSIERARYVEESFVSSPENMRAYIDHYTDGWCIYVESNHPREMEPSRLLTKFSKADLAAAGLKIQQAYKDNTYIYLIRRTDNKISDKGFEFIKPKFVFQKQQDEITQVFDGLRNYFFIESEDYPTDLFLGHMVDEDVINGIFYDPQFADFFGEEAERFSYLKSSDLTHNKFLKKRAMRPNFTILGDVNAINKVLSYEAQPFKDMDIKANNVSTGLQKSAFAGATASIIRANSEQHYLELILNQDFALGAPHFRAAFKNATEEQIQHFFDNKRFVACVVKETKSGAPRIYKIAVRNKKELANAIAQDAIALPHEVYRNAVLAINDRAVPSKLMNLYKRTIVGTFKSIYLTTVGFLMRNELDSAVYKNAASTGGALDILENFKYQYKATQAWDWYNKQQAAMIESTGGTHTLNKKVVRQHLSKLTPAERQTYMQLDIFASSSASGGLSDALEDLLLSYNTKDMPISEYAWAKYYNENILHGTYSPVRFVNDINSQIEQTSRLALYFRCLDEFGDPAEAIRQVVNTHFDYTLREPGMELFEDIFWFSTFPLNNMLYFLNEGLTKNPDMLKLYMDAVELSWNGQGLTWDDVKKSSYLSFNAMAGNLRFKVRDNNIILKTGNSVMDFLNIMANPVDAAKDRLNPFFSVLLGIEPIKELNPLAGVANRAKRFGTEPGKSLVPSVYATMYPRNLFHNPKPSSNYIYPNYFDYRYRRPRKFYPKYMRRQYANTFRFPDFLPHFAHYPLRYTTSISPYWYNNHYPRKVRRRRLSKFASNFYRGV